MQDIEQPRLPGQTDEDEPRGVERIGVVGTQLVLERGRRLFEGNA
jgi:hypothetical protein